MTRNLRQLQHLFRGALGLMVLTTPACELGSPSTIEEAEEVVVREEWTGWVAAFTFSEWPADTMSFLFHEEYGPLLRESIESGREGTLGGWMGVGSLFEEPFPWHLRMTAAFTTEIVLPPNHCRNDRPYRSEEEVAARMGERANPCWYNLGAIPLSISDSLVTVTVPADP